MALNASQVQTAQENYFTTNGKYFQVLPGNTVPSDYTETNVQEGLGGRLGNSSRIDVRQYPNGTWEYTLT